jgi:hypothetical protein
MEVSLVIRMKNVMPGTSDSHVSQQQKPQRRQPEME